MPKATLKGLYDAKTLTYHACSADSFDGAITVRGLPEEWRVLREWCAALRQQGVSLEYAGEG